MLGAVRHLFKHLMQGDYLEKSFPTGIIKDQRIEWNHLVARKPKGNHLIRI